MATKLTGWQAFDLAIQYLRRIWVDGPPGVGKSTAAIRARHANLDGVVQVTLNEDLTVQELIGHFIPKGNVFAWHDGPVTRAMREGSLLVVNELQRASGAVQDMFLAVLDDLDVCRLTLPTGEQVRPHEAFAVIATSNMPLDSLDPALADRFDAAITVADPPPALIAMLNSLLEGLGGAIADSYKDPERAISPRRALAFAELVKAGVAFTDAATITLGSRAADFVTVMKARGKGGTAHAEES